MNIEISGTYRLTSDGLQIVIQRKKVVDPTKSPTFDASKHSAKLREDWKDWKYASSVPSALNIVLNQRILESDATTLAMLRDEIASFRREISAELPNEYKTMQN